MIKIEIMKKIHTNEVINMMRAFYSSPAVLTDASEEIFKFDVENCINDNPYIEGYVFIKNNIIIGYSMLAKSFSTEFGKPCIWIEDLYLKPEYQAEGISSLFFSFIEKKYKNSIFRLEVEKENKYAVKAYLKNGFEALPYMQMKKITNLKGK